MQVKISQCFPGLFFSEHFIVYPPESLSVYSLSLLVSNSSSALSESVDLPVVDDAAPGLITSGASTSGASESENDWA
jgi:hypothetical protein